MGEGNYRRGEYLQHQNEDETVDPCYLPRKAEDKQLDRIECTMQQKKNKTKTQERRKLPVVAGSDFFHTLQRPSKLGVVIAGSSSAIAW